MGSLDGQVALITGAARGQGRSHAVRLARDGADIVALDVCDQSDSVPYALSDRSDLDKTADLVVATGRRVLTFEADVRAPEQLDVAVDAALDEFGGIDIVIANAGIAPMVARPGDDERRVWRDVLDVNLIGAWNTASAAIPSMIDRHHGGSIVFISSTAGLRGIRGWAGAKAYAASKHGIVGVMRSLALDLAGHSIRVNSIHSCGVKTPMVLNPALDEFYAAQRATGTPITNALPVDKIDPEDVSNAVAWLVSDDARYVTGVTLAVDAGSMLL